MLDYFCSGVSAFCQLYGFDDGVGSQAELRMNRSFYRTHPFHNACILGNPLRYSNQS